ncbi:MAG: ribonuclease catalytic domain-containing protein, partial [Gemmatimonadaceae bacterium]
MSDPHHATQHNRGLLLRIAQRAMQERGLLSKFSSDAIAEVNAMHAPASAAVESADVASAPPIRDLTGLLWASIDNDDSRDLDQLTVADNSDMATTRILVAVADVDSLVKDGSAVDRDARHNTTSVYTAAGVFPMLPEKLSTDLTSLNLDAERLAVVVDMTIAADGSVANSELYRALVRNRAKLAYNSVAPWLDGNGEVPPGVASIDGLAENLRVQGRVAERMKALRHVHGALNLETLKARPIFDGDRMSGLAEDRKNSATELISNFMIAANGVTARYLATKNSPSIRRVVRTPKRWNRIVDLAQEHGVTLPANPDSVAL